MQASLGAPTNAPTPAHLTDQRLADLPLHPALVQGIRELGFDLCTPIQAQTLPLALAGADIAGQAQTGTGKTAAFLLALFHHLLTQPQRGAVGQPRALILAPTRELALQIHSDAQDIGRHTGLRLAAIYGGTGYDSQQKQLKAGVEVIIGTPGRVIDFFKQDLYNLKGIEVVVLDEADRMFDLGFIADIRFLLRRMPPPDQRKNYLFSATLSHRVLELAYEHMNSPQRIEIHPERVTADLVRQSLVHVSNDQKLPVLVGLLRQHDPIRTMIFVNTKRRAEDVMNTLQRNAFSAEMLSGDVPQKKREQLIERFKTGDLPILVATDVAARGLHIPEVSHVINFDLPQDAEDYVHRIGRTARAGSGGDAISLCCEEYVYSLPDIERLIGMRIPILQHSDEFLSGEFVKGARLRGEHRGPRRPGPGGGSRRPPQRSSRPPRGR